MVDFLVKTQFMKLMLTSMATLSQPCHDCLFRLEIELLGNKLQIRSPRSFTCFSLISSLQNDWNVFNRM